MRIQLGEFGSLAHLRTSNEEARRKQEDDQDLIIIGGNPYREDADTRIAPSKGFRQLMLKTQVLSSPTNGLIRNRASHTIEVVSLATTIAEILGLNVDLARAIAIGHDIGHVPFGHVGEKFFSKCLNKEFRHEVFGVVRAQKIERRGFGLNLTHQTLSGMLSHSRGSGEMTIMENMSAEATGAMYSDKIDYILSDYNDIVKRNVLPHGETKEVTCLIDQLGLNQRERGNSLAIALCKESVQNGYISFSESNEAKIFAEIKKLMYGLYERVNSHGVEDVMFRVYDFIVKKIPGVNPVLVMSMMNDNDILFLSSKIIFDRSDFNQTSVAEQLPFLRDINPELDLTEPDMDW